MNCWRVGVGCLVVLALGSLSLAQMPEPVRANPAETPVNSPVPNPIERSLNLIDVVLEHHIAPPTRQEMLLSGARSLLTAAKIEPTAELSRRASAIVTRPECLQFLNAAWIQATNAGVDPAAARQALYIGVLQIIPGDANLISAKELAVQNQLQANQYVGIGIALGGKDGAFTMNLFPNGPADKAGAKTGERIEAVDGKPTKGLKLTEVIDRIRGPEGSEVTLLLGREGSEPRTLTITRGVVPRETVHGRNRADDRSPWSYDAVESTPLNYVPTPIAYVDITEIGGSTVHELRQIEQKLRADGMKALIIDLQFDQGLDTHYATMLADALLAGGTIGRIRQGDQVKEITANSDCLFQDWPLAVLVNEHTTGTAEWVAAALQDNKRAIVVGLPTPGDAFVRKSFPVPGTEDELILPAGVLERPSGRPMTRPLEARLPTSTRLRGIPPSSRQSGGVPQSPWGVHPDHVVTGGQRVNIKTGEPTRYESGPDAKGLFVTRGVTVKTDPVAQAVELLREELKRTANSGNGETGDR